MPRIDDYINARKIAVEKLSKESFEEIVERSGFTKSDDDTVSISFLDRRYRIVFPNFEFTDESEIDREVPIQEQVLILHYIMSESLKKPTGHWIAYREIPGASFYFGAFVKRAIDPLKKVFGPNIEGFKKTAGKVHGTPVDAGDAAFEFNVLPYVPLRLILWEGDDEFPAEANILFDETIGNFLSPEDVAWLSGMLVYRLMALSK